MPNRPRLEILPQRYAIVQLEAGEDRPDWIPGDGLVSITWADDETSIVCTEAAVPRSIAPVSRGWRALRAAGPLDLAETGVLSGLARPLAAAGISIYALSTYKTDYLLVPDVKLEDAVAALQGAGYLIDL